MENKITANVECITPDIADKYLRQNNVNRKLNNRTVNFYADQMKRGVWKLNGEPICFAENGDMVNGQHRLTAVIRSNVAVNFLVVRGVEYSSLATYDTGKNRSPSDVFFMENIKNSNNVSALVSRYISLSRNINYKTDNKSCKRSNQDILAEYNKTPEYYQKVNRMAYKYYNKLRIYPASEIGAVIAYLNKDERYDISLIETFFDDLYFSTNKSGCTTITLLRDKLINDSISTHKLRPIYKFILLIKTWNSYRSGKNLKSLKWDEEKEHNIFFR